MCDHDRNNSPEHECKSDCNCKTQELKIGGFLIPCLLLLLKKESSHGYALIEKLREAPFLENMPDPGVIYRYLRNLEEDGMVYSVLKEGSKGPARKIYSLTSEGEYYLKASVDIIKRRKKSMEKLIEAYEDYY